MKWIKCEDEERSAIEIATINEDGLNIEYEVLPAQQRTDQRGNDLMVNRTSLDYKFNDGILGELEGDIGVCCGISRFNAIGLPPCSCKGDVDMVKRLAEVDIDNLREEKDICFVDKFTKPKEK